MFRDELREDRGVDRLGDDPVGRQEEDPAHLERNDTALDGPTEDDRSTEQQCGERVLQARPSRQPEQTTEPLVSAGETRPQSEATAPHGDRRDRHERDHAQRAAERQHELLVEAQVQTRRRSCHRPERQQESDHHDRVADGCHRRNDEAPLRVQNGDRDRTESVQHDLWDEEPQQECRQVLLSRSDSRIRDRRGQQIGQPGSRRHADDGDRAQHDDRHAEEFAGEVFGTLAITGVEVSDEGRYEHRRQRSGGEQFEQDVRHTVRALEGVAQVRGAEDGGDRKDPQRAEAA